MMPPGQLAALLEAPEPSDELKAAISRYHAAVRDAQIAQRLAVTGRWTCLYCTCNGFALDYECVVHGQFLMTPDGAAY